jgi:hypothetical protein
MTDEMEEAQKLKYDLMEISIQRAEPDKEKEYYGICFRADGIVNIYFQLDINDMLNLKKAIDKWHFVVSDEKPSRK